MKSEAIIRPANVFTVTAIQVCMKKPLIPPTHAIEVAVIKLIKRVDDFGEIFRVIISRAVMNRTATTAKRE